MDFARNSIIMISRSAISVCVLMAAACGPEEPVALLTETGCLTASGSEFILTDLEPAGTRDAQPGSERTRASSPTTEAYLLNGPVDELAPLAGRRVRVAGEAGPPERTVIRILQPLRFVDSEADQAQVGVQQIVRLDVNELLVRSISAVEGECG
jgi:hypothetical protein